MSRSAVPRALVAVSLIAAAAGALAVRWMTDDAFISFRYARNLVDGLGLVYNAGERVEGFTNLLWTLWIAAGLALGSSAEAWTTFWGLACYLGAVGLLGAEHLRLRRDLGLTGWSVPLAALGAAAHPDWRIYATGGLETSAFTFLLLAGYVVVVRGSRRTGGALAGGAIFGLAALTRPDGVLPAAVSGLFVMLSAGRRVRPVAAYAAGFLVAWLPATLWRISYYGDFFPNTYYAKSADLAWYSQGARYLLLYFERYFLLLAGPLVLLWTELVAPLAGRRPSVTGDPIRSRALLAGALAASYALYVMRVGGDFMFARMLIPITPFLLILLELAALRVLGRRRVALACCAAAALAALALVPPPVTGTRWRHGVANEWEYYSAARVAALDHEAEVLRRVFRDLPVRIAFFGDEARVMYKVGFPVAIEANTGLTEPELARQPLARRGRVGHEKQASLRWLIEKRGAQFTFSGVPRKRLGLAAQIPDIVLPFDAQVYGQVLRWDPVLMRELAARGVAVPDFEGTLDRTVAELDRQPRENVRATYDRLKLFYFDGTNDPRARAFEERLSRPD